MKRRLLGVVLSMILSRLVDTFSSDFVKIS